MTVLIVAILFLSLLLVFRAIPQEVKEGDITNTVILALFILVIGIVSGLLTPMLLGG